ncbi:MAG: Malto-oligosyltrehalose synthase [Acidobacteria bacterium]|nr:Malto-oligosyltrehalose synthase [Acidobacteriota bacterium]
MAKLTTVRGVVAARSIPIEQLSKYVASSAHQLGRYLAAALLLLHAVPFARVPVSTYRLQFHQGFTFRDAQAVVDYLRDLGISDCYASSYLKAVPGSAHGYDVADPTQLNPEIGTDTEYRAWVDALRARGMGHVMDLVPNHMGIAHSANPWWTDVLENGPSSRYARFFDVEWHPVKDELADKILIPILGDQYGAVLERQELQLAYRDGTFCVRYYDQTLPIAPDTYAAVLDAAIDPWIEGHAGADADELQSILTASRNLPARSDRDPAAIATRVREKEIVKRRLAVLADASPDVAALIEDCVRRLNGTAGQPRSFDPLDRLLNLQSYRLAHWRVASEEINYRRFFDVNELAALRMEDPVVFDEVHRFALELVRQGAVTGLRIDHVDGLYAPGDYLRRLQEQCGSPAHDPFYIVVEKILGAGEQLATDWPVHGTTGYEFAATVNNLFVDRRNERAFDDIYRRVAVDPPVSFADLAYASKKQVLHETMSGDINSLGHQLNRFSERNRHFRDFTLYSLISTLKEVIASFPVYRTYVTADDPISDHDRRYIAEAVRSARRRAPAAISRLMFDFVERLMLKATAVTTPEEGDERARFIGKMQQITSPVAAKGIEDTALYVYNRLVSLNEVGSDPVQFGLEPAAVHDWMAARLRRSPSALSASSTHDTKRGEDVRARINVLSEIPGAWKAAHMRWRSVNRRLKTDVHGTLAPDSNEEYLIYQTLIGAWPFESGVEVETSFRDRITAYLTKALREAKVHTSWMNPDEAYETAVTRFVHAILDRRRPNLFLQAFEPLRVRIAQLGIYNSLAQLLVKITAPGVPDFYQGTELWDLTLVDPDNRRPIDYDARRRALAGLETADPAELLEQRTTGRVKMFVANRALAVRAERRDVFERGNYVPIATAGSRAECLFAFARGAADRVITCVPRLIATLIPDAGAPPLGPGVWGDTSIVVPDGRPMRDVFTGAAITPAQSGGGYSIPAAALFERFPVALLVPRDRPGRPAAPA